MNYQMWSQVKAEDARREAEKYRLIKIACQPSQDYKRQRLVNLVCSFRLARASSRRPIS